MNINHRQGTGEWRVTNGKNSVRAGGREKARGKHMRFLSYPTDRDIKSNEIHIKKMMHRWVCCVFLLRPVWVSLLLSNVTAEVHTVVWMVSSVHLWAKVKISTVPKIASIISSFFFGLPVLLRWTIIFSIFNSVWQRLRLLDLFFFGYFKQRLKVSGSCYHTTSSKFGIISHSLSCHILDL